jgi:hypothetical protein
MKAGDKALPAAEQKAILEKVARLEEECQPGIRALKEAL